MPWPLDLEATRFVVAGVQKPQDWVPGALK